MSVGEMLALIRKDNSVFPQYKESNFRVNSNQMFVYK
jgi:hypothetical protein